MASHPAVIDITTNVNLVLPLDRGKVKGSLKSIGFILWGPWMSVQNVMVVHPIVVEIFQSGPKWGTVRQNGYVCRGGGNKETLFQRQRVSESCHNLESFPPEQQRLRGRGLWDSHPDQPFVHWHQPHCQLAASVYSWARDTDTHTHTHTHTHTENTMTNRETHTGAKQESKHKLLISWGVSSEQDDVTACTSSETTKAWTHLSHPAGKHNSVAYFPRSSVGGLKFQALMPCFTHWVSIHCWECEPANATGRLSLPYGRSKGTACQQQCQGSRYKSLTGWMGQGTIMIHGVSGLIIPCAAQRALYCWSNNNYSCVQSLKAKQDPAESTDHNASG